MRVLHILNELRASGAEVMLSCAGAAWDAAGIEAHVLATGAHVGAYATELERSGYQVHHLPFAPSVGFLRSLRRFIARGGYDLVHIHPERASFWIVLATRTAGVRAIVRSVHSVFSFEGSLRLERTVQRMVARRLGVTFVSVSRSVQENELRRFHNPTLHLSNWLQTDDFVPPSAAERARARLLYGLEERDLAIVTVGNCGSAKNHQAVIEATDLLGDLHPVYLHAGEEEGGRPERELALRMGIADRCRFLGRVEDVRALLCAADVFVMPSHYEGLPIAALEAGATGLPCVLGHAPGLKDLAPVMGSGTAWVVPRSRCVADGIRSMAAVGRSEARLRHESIASVYGVEQGAKAFTALYRTLSHGG
jgi:glycosyltransferase involved in cell wall biosynthesis